MSYQAVFRRYELKYLLTTAQAQRLKQVMQPHMALDRYGRTLIRNLYFDTGDYRLIRRSLEHPVYKEKLRLRSYCRTTPDAPVFAELKKKYRSVVYKRRVALHEAQALDWLCRGAAPPQPSQITAEIDYVLRFYGDLRPAVFLSYEREAFRALDGGDLRLTLDENILSRTTALSLGAEAWGAPLLGRDEVLLEVKTAGGMPLWLVRFLSQEKLYKTSFSKYGAAYRDLIFTKQFGGHLYA